MDNITSVDQLLLTNGLEAPSLKALVPDQLNYKVCLLQPEGNITADSEGVRNTDYEEADKKYGAFLQTAVDSSSDLVVTPEYSLPWRVLETSLRDSRVPALGALWVLGCESTDFEELSVIQKRLGKVKFIYEEISCTESRFLNPVAYVFQTPLKNSDQTQVVVLIQFKTTPMGDDDQFEVNGLICGTQLYQFGGTSSQLRLFTLICSDAFAFTEENAKQLYDKALVIHIQLNPNPRQTVFRNYRANLFKYAGDKTEVIALNCARDVCVNTGGESHCWGNIAGSGWYLRPDEFDSKDSKLQHNHKLGLYYTWQNTDRCHALFFSYDPGVFVVVASKVAHEAVPAVLSKRKGPTMSEIYHWDTGAMKWVVFNKVDDKFSQISTYAGDAEKELVKLADAQPLSVERILAVCSGDAILKSDWYQVEQLDSLTIDNTEIVKRITCCHDTTQAARQFKTTRLRACHRTTRLLTLMCPAALSDFANGYKYEWNISSPHANVVSHAGRRATVIALADNHSCQDAEGIRDKVADHLMRAASTPDDGLDAVQRLQVWYQDDDQQDRLCDQHKYTQYDQTPESPVDIGRAS